MAKSMKVSPKELSNKANDLKKLNSDFLKQVNELKSKESSLNKMWEGEANTTFHNAFSKDAIQMNNFYNAIEKYVSSLDTIAKNYEEAERKNKQLASDRTYGG